MTPASLLIEAAAALESRSQYCVEPEPFLRCEICLGPAADELGPQHAADCFITRLRTAAQESEGGEQKFGRVCDGCNKLFDIRGMHRTEDDMLLCAECTPSSPPTLDTEIEAIRTLVHPDHTCRYLCDRAIDRTVAIMDRRVRELREALKQIRIKLLPAQQTNCLSSDGQKIMDIIRIALGKPDGGRG